MAVKIPQALSRPEETLALTLRVAGLPRPVREHKFCDSRGWLFDFAWPDKMLAVECEGGVHSGGRHTRGVGFEGDIEKYDVAAMLGWMVLRFSSGMVLDGTALDTLKCAHGICSHSKEDIGRSLYCKRSGRAVLVKGKKVRWR